jgi:endoglucanase
VRLNTVGYLPHAPKLATLVSPANVFSIVRASDSAKVYEGAVYGPLRNKDTKEELFIADFSAFTKPGEYRVEVMGVGASAPFRIADDIYTKPFHTVTRGMHLWRCGAAVRGEYNGRFFEHAACHLDDAHLDLANGDSAPKSERHRTATGGWHDAGDYNKYVVNAGVTVGCMLRAWHDFQPQIRRVELNILESDGSLPDFLAEVKWELDWLLSMQADDGSVYHKISTQNYLGNVLPEHEMERRYFGQTGTQATANFVAMMGMAARSFRPFEPAYADRCLAAAEKVMLTSLRIQLRNDLSNRALILPATIATIGARGCGLRRRFGNPQATPKRSLILNHVRSQRGATLMPYGIGAM